MANTVTVTKLLDGPRQFIYHVYLASDGAAGDLADEVLVDPTNEGLPGSPTLTLEDVTWGFTGFDGSLKFELLVDDTLIWVLPAGSGNYVDFKKYGGLKDRSNTNDGTGKLLIDTSGFSAVGDTGSMIIKLRVN